MPIYNGKDYLHALLIIVGMWILLGLFYEGSIMYNYVRLLIVVFVVLVLMAFVLAIVKRPKKYEGAVVFMDEPDQMT